MLFPQTINKLFSLNIPSHLQNKKFLIYGTGAAAHSLYVSQVRSGNLDILGFYDSNPGTKTHCFGYKIYSRSEFEALDRNTPIVIATTNQMFFHEIAADIQQLGFTNIVTSAGYFLFPKTYDMEESRQILRNNRTQIEKAYEMLEDAKSKEIFEKIIEYRLTNNFHLLHDIYEKNHKQYFPFDDIFSPCENEVFIDGGCLDAKTIKDFVDWTQGDYLKVYAFEPSAQDKIIADEYIDLYGYKAECVAAGLYNKNTTLSFTSNLNGGSGIKKDGSESVQVVRLDDFMENKPEKVTFLKLDVEGSELAALEGSLKIIQTHHPKLAISIYHRFNDLWELQLYLHSVAPGYKFYIRHHSVQSRETILYGRYEE